MKIPFLIPIFVFSSLTAILNFIATKLYLYWAIFWFDSPTHFMGGFISSLIFWSAVLYLNNENIKSNPRIYTILAVLFIGIAWEIFELFFRLTSLYSHEFFIDTFSDIIFDIFGGLFAYYYLVRPNYVGK